jgi:hypothetical protein
LAPAGSGVPGSNGELLLKFLQSLVRIAFELGIADFQLLSGASKLCIPRLDLL